ncbi:MAG: hypothetical protein GY947_07275 [Rhodobacteraceae bacterium]|nr:hypothetical protein [Paracoccaceae bacterium]
MPEQQPVKRRHLVYVPGYDPVPPRRYRELYRTEGTEQAHISGYELTLSPGKPEGPNYGWSVDSEIDGRKTRTEAEVLMWSDIVQQSMNRNIPGTYLLLLRTVWAYVASGALFGLMRLRIGPILAALYPIAMLLLQLLVAVIFGGAVIWLLSYKIPQLFAVATGLGFAALILIWFRKNDRLLFAYYLMHDYGFSAQFQGANPPELEARMAVFADRITQLLQTDADEVLIVGHSSGAHLAVSILADVVRSGAVRPDGPALSLLTLGQVIPMVSFLPRAERLRADLHYLCQQDCLTWVDVSAPGDGANFALCDAVSVSGVAPKTGKLHPLVLSAAFSQTLSPAAYARIRKRFFRLHFQYLCAFDRPGDYDYFRVTAGSMTLRDRYQGRNPSPSRIELPANRFKTIGTA